MERSCTICGATFEVGQYRGNSKRSLCSQACQSEGRQRSKSRYRERRGLATSRTCRDCSAPIALKLRRCRPCAKEATRKARLAYQYRYMATERGKAVIAARVSSAEFKAKKAAAQEVRRALPDYSVMHREWLASPEGQAAIARHRASEKRKTCLSRSGARRRSRVRALPATLTAGQWRAIVVAFNGCCAYCGIAPSVVGPLQIEHVVPCSAGGGLTAENVVPACAACNHSKAIREVGEWMRERGFDAEKFAERRATAAAISATAAR